MNPGAHHTTSRLVVCLFEYQSLHVRHCLTYFLRRQHTAIIIIPESNVRHQRGRARLILATLLI
jgi:hypothetical protein